MLPIYGVIRKYYYIVMEEVKETIRHCEQHHGHRSIFENAWKIVGAIMIIIKIRTWFWKNLAKFFEKVDYSCQVLEFWVL